MGIFSKIFKPLNQAVTKAVVEKIETATGDAVEERAKEITEAEDVLEKYRAGTAAPGELAAAAAKFLTSDDLPERIAGKLEEAGDIEVPDAAIQETAENIQKATASKKRWFR